MDDSKLHLPWKDVKKERREFAHSHALIIGINDYKSGIRSLSTAVNDACRLAEILEKDHGYRTTLLTEDVTYARVKTELCEHLVSGIGDDDRFLFYFAGHGIATAVNSEYDEPEGFLLLQNSVQGQSSTYLPMAHLHHWLANLRCRHLLAILDCCFAGAFRWSITREANLLPDVVYEEKYWRYIQDPAWQAITSASYDQAALDHLGGDRLGKRGESTKYSPFAQALFDGLAGKADLIPRGQGDGLITATELQLYLREAIDNDFNTIAQRRQTPELWQLRKHRKGEFVFKLRELALPLASEYVPDSNPYCGLGSYDEANAALFFGRHEQSEKLFSRVCEQPLTIVLGASGTGKSSLVKAGLLPRLRRSINPTWQVLPILRPGTEPLHRLYNIFAVDSVDSPVQGANAQDGVFPSQWVQAVTKLTKSHAEDVTNRFLLVVDQVEELVTLCQAEERAQLIEHLYLLLTHFAEQIHIVLTLRNDFESHIRNTPLQTYWECGRFVVAPMNQQELKEAIECPAAERILFFDPPELVGKIAEEVMHERHALPLLSFTLSELYLRYLGSKKRNRALTSEDYDKMGGVIGILSRRADEIYKQFDEAHQLTMRRLLLRMVTIESGEKARRRVSREELTYPWPLENQRVQRVLDELVAARLLAVETAQESQDVFVEPAHEALINSWDKLSEWLREEDETILLHRNLTQAATIWLRAKGNDKKGLLWSRDPRLAQLHQLLAPCDYAKGRILQRTFFPTTQVSNSPTWFNVYELKFVQESIRQKAKFARWILILTMLSLVAAGVLWNLYRIANTERQTRQIADSRRLANIALQEIATNPIHSIELSRSGLPGAGRERPYVPEAENALTQAIQRNQLRQTVAIQAKAAEQVAFSPEAIAIGGESLTLLDRRSSGSALQISAFNLAWLATTAPISPTHLLDEAVDVVAWANNGDLLSLSTHTARIWRNGELIQTRTMDELGQISCTIWSPTSDMIAFCADKQVWVWLLASDEILALSPFSAFVNGVSWSADGQWLAVATSNQVTVHAIAGGEPIVIFDSPAGDIQATRFISSTELLTWGYDGLVQHWSSSGKLLTIYENRRSEGRFQDVQLSPDQTRLAAAYDNGSIVLWPRDDVNATPTTLRGHSGKGVLDLAWHDNYLASAGADGTINIWDWRRGVLVTRLVGDEERIHRIAWEPDGQHLISYGQDGALRTWQIFDAHGFPICDLGDGIVETWRCTTLLRIHLQLEKSLAEVIWVANEHIVGTTISGEIWTWRIGDSLTFHTNEKPPASDVPAGRKAMLSRSGLYGFIFTPQGAGELWRNVSGVWIQLNILGQTMEDAFWSGDQLFLITPPNQLDVVTIDAGAYAQHTIYTAGDRTVWDSSVHNTRLAVAYTDGILAMFDLGSQKQLFTISSEQSVPWSDFTWLDSGTKLLMQANHSGAIALIDANNGNPIWPALWHDQGFDPLPPAPNPAQTYAIFAIDSTLYGLNLHDGTELILAQLLDTIRGLQWNRSGSRLLTWDSGGVAHIWHWNETELSLTQILELRTRQSIQWASYSPDETSVLTAAAEGDLQIWKVWPTLESLLEIVPEN